MGLFTSLKGEGPSVPQTQQSAHSMSPNPFRRHHPQPSNDPYTPPPGSPPSHAAQHSVTGNPAQTSTTGPPMTHASQNPFTSDEYAPPPGPPPSHQRPDHDPPPYHDWTVVPDTALLPPPPSIGHELSPSGNAESDEADRAHAWCKTNKMMMPHQPTPEQIQLVAAGNLGFIQPQEFSGHLTRRAPGQWRGSTRPGSRDCCLLSNYPLYFACVDPPRSNTARKLIYYEVKINSLGRARGGDASSIAIGFSAVPYPSWRMPGWERGSLAVHSDDGRRYVNDTWGGKDFVPPFQAGETIGLGMRFETSSTPPQYNTPTSSVDVQVFLTRNGRESGTWDVHEQLDASSDEGIDGLDGAYDLYAALGIFGGVDFEVYFQRPVWMWQQG